MDNLRSERSLRRQHPTLTSRLGAVSAAGDAVANVRRLRRHRWGLPRNSTPECLLGIQTLSRRIENGLYQLKL
jgi:hypothetical protein